MNMAKNITIATHKGGQAKTTTAKNLGVSASKIGKTLLIDLDPQRNLSNWLGVARNLNKDIASVFRGIPAEKCIAEIEENLHIIPGSLRMSRVSRELISRPNRERVLKKTLADIFKKYDFVIIDTPPDLDDSVANGVVVADLIIVPIAHEAGSTEGLTDFKEFAREVLDREPNIKHAITKVNKSKTVMYEYIHDALKENGLYQHLLKTELPTESAVDQSNIAGMKLEEYAKQAKNIQKHADLLQEILQYV